MKKKLKIIYEDKELLVIDKPAGMLTIATEKEKLRTLYHEAREYVKKQNPKNKIFIVHRLDKETSGIVVFAKNEELKHKLQNHWEDLVSVREYTALLSGHLKKNKGRYESYLRESKTLQVYSVKDKNGKLAVTEYEVLDKNKEYDLVQIHILTGRKNQIRVHMSDLGAPIAGDKKYGAKKNPYRRLCLHANKLILEHPRTHKKFIFESEIPTLFYQAVENK